MPTNPLSPEKLELARWWGTVAVTPSHVIDMSTEVSVAELVAEIERLKAENAMLRGALEKIRDYQHPQDGDSYEAGQHLDDVQDAEIAKRDALVAELAEALEAMLDRYEGRNLHGPSVHIKARAALAKVPR